MTDADSADAVWARLRTFTQARIAQGRTGHSLPLAEVLAFQSAHALARDAVLQPVDWSALQTGLAARGIPYIYVFSEAESRDAYLRRPDLGRRLTKASLAELSAWAGEGCDVVLIVGDGLSSAAVAAHALPVLERMVRYAQRAGWQLAPIVLAQGARVALSDAIGEALKAAAAAILIGERPGLSSADSLGIYLTYAPRPGVVDAARNCISNIHAAGLSYDLAAHKLNFLLSEALRRKLSGVDLKDRSDEVPLLLP